MTSLSPCMRDYSLAAMPMPRWPNSSGVGWFWGSPGAGFSAAVLPCASGLLVSRWPSPGSSDMALFWFWVCGDSALCKFFDVMACSRLPRTVAGGRGSYGSGVAGAAGQRLVALELGRLARGPCPTAREQRRKVEIAVFFERRTGRRRAFRLGRIVGLEGGHRSASAAAIRAAEDRDDEITRSRCKSPISC